MACELELMAVVRDQSLTLVIVEPKMQPALVLSFLCPHGFVNYLSLMNVSVAKRFVAMLLIQKEAQII